MSIVREGELSISFEFFPPQTAESETALWSALAELQELKPNFVSITYGAGGTTRDRSVELTRLIGEETSLRTVGHLTCVGHTVRELWQVAEDYEAAEVAGLLALRGDPKAGPGSEWTSTEGGFDHADQLVEMLSKFRDLSIGVAAFPTRHPESRTLKQDAAVLARKASMGADFAITQFFFDASDYARLVDRVSRLGCRIPIVPGIMPITNYRQIERFAKLSGTPVPRAVAERFEDLDDESVRALGVELSVELCEVLLALGAPGLHFYTLNSSSATREIHEALGLRATPPRQRASRGTASGA